MTLAETSGAQAESTWEEQGGGWWGRQAEDSVTKRPTRSFPDLDTPAPTSTAAGKRKMYSSPRRSGRRRSALPRRSAARSK